LKRAKRENRTKGKKKKEERSGGKKREKFETRKIHVHQIK